MVRKLPWRRKVTTTTMTITAVPVVEVEREAAETLSLMLVPSGQSGLCVCDNCIIRIWRPLIAQLGNRYGFGR
jgi:hypothetical protein